MAGPERHSVVEHDWHSDSYVDWWIGRDAEREAARRERLREMLARVRFAPDAAIAVLDVGGGYGVLTEEVLRAFPRARVTLQDYSQPMLDAARRRLAAAATPVSFVHSDLCDPGWVDRAGGPFDLAVSSIAIHNLREEGRMAAAYRGIAVLLKPGASFLDYDIFDRAGGVALHTRLLRAAGFAVVDCPWHEPPAAIIDARAAG